MLRTSPKRAQRETLVALLRYLGNPTVPHWASDAAAARLLASAVDNNLC